MVLQSKHNNVIILVYCIQTPASRDCVCVCMCRVSVSDSLAGSRGCVECEGQTSLDQMSISVMPLRLIVQTWLVEWDRDHWPLLCQHHWQPGRRSRFTRSALVLSFFLFFFPWSEGSVRVIANETRVLMLGWMLETGSSTTLISFCRKPLEESPCAVSHFSFFFFFSFPPLLWLLVLQPQKWSCSRGRLKAG